MCQSITTYIKVVKKDDDQYRVYRKVTDVDNKVSTDDDYFVDNKGDTYESSKIYEVKKLAEKTYKITRNFDVKPLFYYWGINKQDDYSDDIEYDGIRFLGEIYISYERCVSQAKDYGHSLKREFCYLAVHGLLHLLGYDHMVEEDKKVMRSLEEEILNEYDIKR